MLSRLHTPLNSQVSFYGHETFPFRHSWLWKGINAVSQDPAFFARERAMVELGVGKNMVQAIRYWCLAAQLMGEDFGSGAGRGRYVPTKIGRRIFASGGFDPYMEDPATLWLLHWLIASNARQATTWFWMFSHWNNTEFTKERAADEIQAWLEKHGYRPVSENSLKRDVDCFVRTYTRGRQSKQAILEDSLDCPLVELRLISELGDGRTHQFQRGPQTSLPNEVLAFALVEFWRACNSQTNTLAFAKIAHDPSSPGRVFKLDEDSLASRLERLEALTKGALYYDETSGLKQVSKRSEVAPLELLTRYYRPRVIGAASTR
jgi:hypothetical protein